MPCYLPVYERLLKRQRGHQTQASGTLRGDFVDHDRSRPRKARSKVGPGDASVPASREEIKTTEVAVDEECVSPTLDGMVRESRPGGITTHQTRATLATSLLNNGAHQPSCGSCWPRLLHGEPCSLRAIPTPRWSDTSNVLGLPRLVDILTGWACPGRRIPSWVRRGRKLHPRSSVPRLRVW